MKSALLSKRRFCRVLFFILVSASFMTCEKPERVVKLTTLDAAPEDIAYTSATLKGDITDLGTEQIDDHGIFLSENSTPVQTNSVVKAFGTCTTKGVFQAHYTNLISDKLYYFRAYVSINSEIIYGEIKQFRTKVTQSPTVIAGTISAITRFTASLNGEVTFDGGDPNTKRGLCWGLSANPTIESCVDTTVNGTGAGTYTGTMDGLSAGREYFVRCYALNSKGIVYHNSFGTDDITFKTHDLPEVITNDVNAVTNTTASAGGNVINDGNVYVSVKGVCWSNNSGPTASLTTKTEDGDGEGIFTSSVSDLNPGTTYYLRAYATNQYGTSYGDEIDFHTTEPALSTTTFAGSVTTSSAVINGNVNPNNLSTTVTFEYGTLTSYGMSVTALQSPISGSSSVDVSALISGLIPGTTYHFRVVGESTAGTSFGNDMTFITQHIPDVITSSATSVSSQNAQLNATVNAWNLSTIVTFEYGTSAAYGMEAVASQSPVSGSSATTVSAPLTGLLPGTTYHYRVKAESIAGTIYGDDQEFTTLFPPSATTLGAASIAVNTAFLHGTVNANNTTTTVTFEYGTGTSYGMSVTASQSPVSGSVNLAVSAGITGLLEGTLYHYRVKAVSDGGTAYGDDYTFTTLRTPSASTGSATAVANIQATVNGTINPFNISTVVTFEYGTSASYGQIKTATASPVSGNSDLAVSADLSGLATSTTYHYRVKAENTAGITYGNDMTFTTNAYISDIDGNTYNTVTIGGKVWMQQNLKTTHYNNGEALPKPADIDSWAALTTGAYSWYLDDPVTYKATYGAYYNWYTGIDVRNICPVGWHVPVEAEKNNLGFDGGGLKEAGTLHWDSPNDFGTNVTGFTGLPGGWAVAGTGGNMGREAIWWFSTEYDATSALKLSLTFNMGTAYYTDYSKTGGFNIRCIKGELPLVQITGSNVAATSTAEIIGKVNPNGVTTTVTFEYGLTKSYGEYVIAPQSPVSGTAPVNVNANLSGLTPGTVYHFRLRAENAGGINYSLDGTFTTDPANVSDIDGNVYGVIRAGSQLWTNENLKVTKLNDNTPIQYITENISWKNQVAAAYCWYNNDDITNKTVYGGLYNFYAVNTTKLCPQNWHVATDQDWKALEMYLGMTQGQADELTWRGTTQGNMLKESGNIHWNSPSAGTNTIGFTGLPAGIRTYDFGLFTGLQNMGYFWTSSQYNSSTAYKRVLDYSHAEIYRDNDVIGSGFSVRCVRD